MLELGTYLSDGFYDDDSVNAYHTESQLFLTAESKGLLVGALTYLGGLLVDDELVLPYGDTPKEGDVFGLYSTKAGDVLRVDCADGTTNCENFKLTVLQNLQHLGPYIPLRDFGSKLDLDRVNKECLDSGVTTPCGGFTFAASSFNGPSAVPEPTTLALIGLGLMGLGLSRRARAR